MNTQTRQYTEDAVKIDLSGLIRNGFMVGGREGKSTGSINGQILWSIGWRISNEMDKLEVNYTSQNKHHRHSIVLTDQSVHWGGSRMYLTCDLCGTKTKQLYIVSNSVGCRECHRLDYKTQSKTETERELDKYLRLSRKVDYFGLGVYSKRKYQHWETFSKIHTNMDAIHLKYPHLFN